MADFYSGLNGLMCFIYDAAYDCWVWWIVNRFNWAIKNHVTYNFAPLLIKEQFVVFCIAENYLDEL